jgi:hypothetical protein
MHNTSLWIGLAACLLMALLVGLTALGSRWRRSHGGSRSNRTDPGGYWIPVMGDGGGHPGGHGSCDGGSSGGGGDCSAS